MRSSQAGFVTLAALVDVVIITLIGAILMTSLFGEIQGEFGYNEAVGATSAAEAGLHWAGNKLSGTSATTQVYQGDVNQTLQSAGGQSVGAFARYPTCCVLCPVTRAPLVHHAPVRSRRWNILKQS